MGRQMINGRIQPRLGPEYYKTYSWTAPLGSHWRQATCLEYECEDFQTGFVLSIDTSTDLGQKQYFYVTHDRDRSYTMQRVAPDLYKFVYKPGNECFKRGEHRVPIGRPPFYLVHEGDWRGNPRGTPTLRHRRPEDWIDQFANHNQELSDAVKRG